MDLGAFAQIPNIEAIATANGIGVPRLRGYRLMTNEELMTHDDMVDFISGQIVDDLVHSCPFWKPDAFMYGYGESRREAEKRYIRIVEDQDGHKYRVPRWENIKGWKRKVLKQTLHNELQKYKKQDEMWNKYCGRNDVLYVHARIGGGNWASYKEDVRGELLDRIDDAYDCTYCDLYFKIKPVYEEDQE